MDLKKLVRVLREGTYESFCSSRVMSLKMKHKCLAIGTYAKNIYKEFREVF